MLHDQAKPSPLLPPDIVTPQDVHIRLQVLELVQQGELPTTPEHECPYLPDRDERCEAFLASALHPETYQDLMEMGFRRSGRLFYRAACAGCDACQSLRIPVADFIPTRSQRRARRRNADVTLHIGRPRLTDEKFDLYLRYLESQHPDSPQREDARNTLRDFLYESPVHTVELTYRDSTGQLLAVSISDVCRRGLSSVYHYFDPDHARRSLGVHSALAEIELCQAWSIPHYYLGYWVAGAKTMGYKANYRPHEVLRGGAWRRVEQA